MCRNHTSSSITITKLNNKYNNSNTSLLHLLQVYISLHAYSQAWLLPSTHMQATFADDGMLLDMGKLATTALADMYGTKYQVIYV